MKRRQTETVGEVLAQYLRASGIETPLLQHRLVQLWPSVVGEQIAQYTEAIEVREQALWVRVHAPALRSQLMMMRQQLVRQLNEAVQHTLIYDLKMI